MQHLDSLVRKAPKDNIESIIKNKLSRVKNNKSVRRSNELARTDSPHARVQFLNSTMSPIKKIMDHFEEEEKVENRGRVVKNSSEPRYLVLGQPSNKVSRTNFTKMVPGADDKTVKLFKVEAENEGGLTKRRFVYEKENMEGEVRLSMPRKGNPTQCATQ
jgi:hypothetical protein